MPSYGALTDRWIDLRIDDHERPMAEIGRLLELHRLFFDRPSAPASDPRQSAHPTSSWRPVVRPLTRRPA